MKTLKLSSGHEMPVLGLGTWRAKGETTKAVITSLEQGYRLLDCAAGYRNEGDVGAGIRDCIDRGIVKREDIFITSKLWCTQYRPDLVRGALKDSMDKLGVEYIDLYLIHWPFAFQESDEVFPKDEFGNIRFADIDHLDTWKVLEELVDEKKIRTIGVSNFNKRLIKRLWTAARIKPSVLQVEIHPYCPNLKLVDFAKSLGMQVTAYSSLGSPANVPPTSELPGVLKEPAVQRMSRKYKKSPAQILLRYAIERGTSVIPKSVSPHWIEQNMQIFDFKLTDEEMLELNSFGLIQRTMPVIWASKHRFYPFKDEY